MLITALVFAPALGQTPFKAEVSSVLVSDVRSEDNPDLRALRIGFDVKLTNQANRAVDLPAVGARESGGLVWLEAVAVQTRQPGERWAYLVQSTIIDAGDAHYRPCRSLGKGETTTMRSAATELFLPVEKIKLLGTPQLARLDLMFLCRASDGSVQTISVRTEPFILRVQTGR